MKSMLFKICIAGILFFNYVGAMQETSKPVEHVPVESGAASVSPVGVAAASAFDEPGLKTQISCQKAETEVTTAKFGLINKIKKAQEVFEELCKRAESVSASEKASALDTLKTIPSEIAAMADTTMIFLKLAEKLTNEINKMNTQSKRLANQIKENNERFAESLKAFEREFSQDRKKANAMCEKIESSLIEIRVLLQSQSFCEQNLSGASQLKGIAAVLAGDLKELKRADDSLILNRLLIEADEHLQKADALKKGVFSEPGLVVLCSGKSFVF